MKRAVEASAYGRTTDRDMSQGAMDGVREDGRDGIVPIGTHVRLEGLQKQCAMVWRVWWMIFSTGLKWMNLSRGLTGWQ